MTFEEVKKMCVDIAAAQHVDITCPIKLNGRLKTTLGRVTYEYAKDSPGKLQVKAIEFSKQHVEVSDTSDVIDTIIHEMTHYILFTKTGEKHGHDAAFKKLNKELGGDGERCASIPRIKPKYTLYCKTCGQPVGEYYRAGRTIKNANFLLTKCCHAGIEVVQNY